MSKEDFYELTPNQVLAAVEHAGFLTTGEFQQLNSYENRVFDVVIENDEDLNKKSLIAKFYRPGRWSKPCIEEEHHFLFDLLDEGLPAVAPLKLKNNATTFEHSGMWTTLFPKARGRMVEELSLDDFKKIGRTLARFHTIGARKNFKHRPRLSAETYGYQSLERSRPFIAPEVVGRYEDAAEELLHYLDERLEDLPFLRIHGDCHKGNLLSTDPRSGTKEFFFVDFDDCAMGPAVQDIWMLFSEETPGPELNSLLEGYEEFKDFNYRDLNLIPALRGLRIIYYSGWIARRWDDPSFPRLFPQFKDYNHWAFETEALERTLNAIN